MGGVEGCLPTGVQQRVAPAASVGQVITPSTRDKRHAQSGIVEAKRQLPMLVDVDLVIEPPDARKASRETEKFAATCSRPQHCTVRMMAEGIELQFVQSPWPDSRIDTGLGPSRNGVKILTDLTSGDSQTVQFGRRNSGESLLFPQRGVPVSGSRRSACTAVERLPSADQPLPAGVRQPMVIDQVWVGYGVAV